MTKKEEKVQPIIWREESEREKYSDFFKNLQREKRFSRVRWLLFERTQKKKVSNEISKELTRLDMLKTEHSYH